MHGQAPSQDPMPAPLPCSPSWSSAPGCQLHILPAAPRLLAPKELSLHPSVITVSDPAVLEGSVRADTIVGLCHGAWASVGLIGASLGLCVFCVETLCAPCPLP